VPDAAKVLGVTPEAIRQRIKRGTIEFEHEPDGRYYVFLAPTEASSEGPSEEFGNGNPVLLDYVESLKRELEDWKEEARRKDAIIITMAQRIPELEPATEPREEPETASDGTERVEKTPPEREHDSQPWWEPRKQPKTAFDRWESGAVPHEDRDDSRSWWKRLFGFE